MVEWKHYNVHWHMTGDTNQKGKTSITALDKEDAKRAFEARCRNEAADQRHYPFEAKVDKVIGPLGLHQATNKQRLSRKYGFTMGGIKGAKAMFISAFPDLHANDKDYKLTRAIALVNQQFSKLERDLRDLFKLAGLKVK